MVVYQLKVMMNTSIPSQDGYVELTSDLLNYEVPPGKAKKTLSKYPFYDPEAEYPRVQIQNLPYYKQLEVFFNKEKFEAIVLQYSKEIKKTSSYNDSIYENDAEDDDDDDNTVENQKYNKRMNIQQANFEFTIKTILCTGFPPDNYNQSMEYYDSTIRKKHFTMKGTNWLSFLPSRFDLRFSYLNMNNSLYTIHRVVWVNDALNHPRYSSIINSIQSDEDDSKNKKYDELFRKIETELDMEYTLFIIKVSFQYDNLVNVIPNNRSSNSYEEKKRINTNITTFMDTCKSIQTLDLSFNINDFLKDFKLSTKDKDNKEWLFSKLILLQTNIEEYQAELMKDKDKKDKKTNHKENEDKAKKDKEAKEKKINYYSTIIDFINELNKQKEYSKIALDTFINNNSYSNIDKYLNDSRRKTEVLKFLKRIHKFIIQKRAIEYSRNNSNFSDDPDKKEIEEYIQTNFKEYSDLTSQLKDLYKAVDISNPYWKKLVEQYYNDKGLSSYVPQVNDEEDNDMIKILKECDENNKFCKRKNKNNKNKKAYKYLNIGLDELKVTATATTNEDKETSNNKLKSSNAVHFFEAYLMIDVVEGKITPENLSQLRCSYMDSSAGDLWRKIKMKTSENYITKDKFFISLKEQIANIEASEKNPTKTKKAGKHHKSFTRKKRGFRLK